MDASAARHAMVERQIRARGIRDARVLAAFEAVPRDAFVAPAFAAQAYDDRPLPIAAGQTISQPFIVALMVEAAGVQPRDRVLEIGTGSGYAAAILGRLAEQVYTIERHAELAELARDRLAALGSRNVEVACGDGTLGWPEHAPYAAIVVAAGGPEVPATLLDQLAIGGRLVMPVGSSHSQQLVRVTRRGDAELAREDLGEVVFVPLIGAHGWTGGLTGSTRRASRSG